MQNWSLLEAKIKLTPMEFAHYLQAKGDLFWWERGNFWVITAYDLAKEVLLSDDFTCDRSPFFISRMPNLDLSLIQDFFSVVGRMMVMSDADEHRRRRRICYDGFSSQALTAMEPLIKKTIAQAFMQTESASELEFVETVAKKLPSTVLADFFHIPAEERENFYRWSNNMTQFFGGASQYRNEDGVEVNHSAKSLHDYFADLMLKKRKQPGSDFLSVLIAHQSAFDLTDEEIISQAIMMLVAGQVTTTDQLCNNLYTLLSTPHALSQLQDPHIDWGNVLDELNRLDPAVTFIFRVTKCDTVIGEKKIKKGDVIFISTHAVNRDARVFISPDACDFYRPAMRELSYGFGAHYCLGAKLARLEMKHCLQALMQHFSQINFIPTDLPQRKHHSLAFSGFERFMLQVSPGVEMQQQSYVGMSGIILKCRKLAMEAGKIAMPAPLLANSAINSKLSDGIMRLNVIFFFLSDFKMTWVCVNSGSHNKTA
jgi:cytochrome P450